MNRTIVALPLLFALAACGGGADEPPTDLESAQSDGAVEALARNFETGDFLDLQLGAKIVGRLAELQASRALGFVRSRVAGQEAQRV